MEITVHTYENGELTTSVQQGNAFIGISKVGETPISSEELGPAKDVKKMNNNFINRAKLSRDKLKDKNDKKK